VAVKVFKNTTFYYYYLTLLIKSVAAMLSLIRPTGDALGGLYRSFWGWGR